MVVRINNTRVFPISSVGHSMKAYLTMIVSYLPYLLQMIFIIHVECFRQLEV